MPHPLNPLDFSESVLSITDKVRRIVTVREHIPGQSVLDAALLRIAEEFKESDTVVVGFSGGKDSTVLLNLVDVVARQIDRNYYILYFDEEIVDPDTLRYIDYIKTHPRFSKRFIQLAIPYRHTLRAKKKSFWFTWDTRERDKWYRPVPENAITYDHIPEIRGYAFDGYQRDTITNILFCPSSKNKVTTLTAVRTAESPNRKRVLNMVGTHWSYIDNAEHHRYSKPIYDWTTVDVWVAIRKFKWEYSRYYDRLSVYDVPIALQRVGPLGVVNGVKTVTFWQQCYPLEFAKACRRLPPLRTMARYGDSELVQPKRDKPDGLTWMEWTLIVLKSLDEESQKYWQEELVGIMRRYERKYTQPMPDDNFKKPHLSWRILCDAVSKNDRIDGGSRDISI